MKRKILKCVSIALVFVMISFCIAYGETEEPEAGPPEEETLAEDVSEDVQVEEEEPRDITEVPEVPEEEIVSEDVSAESAAEPVKEKAEEKAPEDKKEEAEKLEVKEEIKEEPKASLTPVTNYVYTYRVFEPVNNSILEYPLSRTAILTSGFGLRKPFITQSGEMSSSNHKGIDLAISQGTPIIAAESGTVIKAEYYGGYGNCVFIDHGSGLVTRYGHMSEINVTQGQRVVRGQQIGLVGNTGNSAGAHLHFEVVIDGVAVDPLPYLEEVKETLERTPQERLVEDIPLDLVVIISNTEKVREIYEFLYGEGSYIEEFVSQNVNNRVSVIFTGEMPKKTLALRTVKEPWVTIRNLTEAKSHIICMDKEAALSVIEGQTPKIVLEIKNGEYSVTCSSASPSATEQALLWKLVKDFSEII